MQQRNRTISVVIPNYNGLDLLRANLPALFIALDRIPADHEVIVVDDCSTDTSCDFLREAYPQVRLLINEQNKGFSGTINRGIQAAKKDLIFCLNSDVLLLPDYFEAQMAYFDDAHVFGVMGRIIGLEDDVLQDAAKYPEFSGLMLKGSVNYLAADGNNSGLPSLFLSGANALVDRQKMQALNGFDEIYSPFYVEDLDLGLRAWRMGWMCLYEDRSVCRHPTSATIGAYHKRRKIKITAQRNKWLFHRIHLSGIALILFRLKLLSGLLGWAFIGRFEAYTAYAEYRKRLPFMENSRERMERLSPVYSLGRTVQVIREAIGTRQTKRF